MRISRTNETMAMTIISEATRVKGTYKKEGNPLCWGNTVNVTTMNATAAPMMSRLARTLTASHGPLLAIVGFPMEEGDDLW